MTLSTPVIRERRKFSRQLCPPRLAVNLLQPRASLGPTSVNVSEGGLCLQLQEMLEVRSLVQLQLIPQRSRLVKEPRPVHCTGRVAWVVQRLDLRDSPPFLFDTGIEFVDPPPLVRRLLSVGQGRTLIAPRQGGGRIKQLDTSVIRGRHFIPRLERDARQGLSWHLVGSVDGVACFSGRYPSQVSALAAWAHFKRAQAKR